MNGEDFAQDAADRLNVAAPPMGYEAVWEANDYSKFPEPKALADALAELAQRDAELAAIKADMAEIDRLLGMYQGVQAQAIAAKRRPAPDPLVEALRVAHEATEGPSPDWDFAPEATRIRTELAKHDAMLLTSNELIELLRAIGLDDAPKLAADLRAELARRGQSASAKIYTPEEAMTLGQGGGL